METKRLILRPIQPEDFSELYLIYNKALNMRYILTGKSDWSMETLKEKWDKEKFSILDNCGFQVVVLKSTNKVIGEAGLLKTTEVIDQKLELAYLIDEKYWGQGLGTELCQGLIEYAFNSLKVECVVAGMYKANQASARIVEKLGMTLIEEGISPGGIHFLEYELKKK